MAIVSDVEIRLMANLARLHSDMASARKTVDKAFGDMSSSAATFKKLLAGIGIGLGIKEVVTQLITAQREFDKLNASLITATGSSSNAAQAFKALQQFAARTPYDLKQTTEAFLKLRNLGLTPSERALTSYGNTAGALGKDLMQMVEAVADATTGEFERLKEFGIKAKQNGDQVSLTFQGVTTKIGNNAAEIEKYLIGLGETKFAGGMALQAKTLDGVISNLGDTWQAVLRTTNESGFGDAAMSSVLSLIGALTDLQAIITVVGESFKSGSAVVEEYSVIHRALTTVFEALAIGAEIVAYTVRNVTNDVKASAAIADAIFSGEFKKASQLYDERKKAQAEDARLTDARIEKITWAARVAEQVRKNEAEARERDKEDQLAGFKVVTDGKKQQTAAEEKAAKDALTWYNKIREASIDQLAQLEAEREGGAALTAEEKKRIEVLNDMERVGKVLSAQQKQDIRGYVDATVEVAKYNKELERNQELRGGMIGEARGRVLAAEKETNALRDQIQYYGLKEDAVLSLKAAEYERQLQNEDLDAIEQGRLQGLLDETSEQIKLQTKLTKMKADTAFWTSLEDAAHQTFLSISNGNKDLWTRLRDTAKNIFFEWLYQQTVKKWIINIGTSFDGAGAVSGIAQAASGGSGSGGILGAFSSGSSLLSIGKMIYSGFSTGIASSLGSVITTLGNTFGSAAVSSFGTGMGLTTAQASTAAAAYGGTSTAVGGGLSAGASAASAIPIIGWIIAGMNAANGFRKEGFTPNNGTISNPLAQAFTLPTNFAEKSLGWLGMNKALSNIFSGAAINTKLFGRADPRVESSGIQGTLSAAGFNGKAFTNILEKGGWFRSDKRYTKTADLSTETQDYFDTTMEGILTAVKGFGSVVGAEASAIDGYSKALKLTLTDDGEKNKALIAEVFGGVADELSLRLVPSLAQFQKEGETLSATLQRVAQDYAALDLMLGAIGKSFGAVGAASITARETLIELAGGVDALASGLSYFQQNFLTDAERLAPVQKQVSETLAAMGLSALKTNDQLKTYLLGLDLTDKAQAELFTKLLALAPAYKEVADAATAAATAAAAAAKAAEDLAASQAAAALQAIADKAKILSGSVDSALQGVTRAVDAQKEQASKAYEALTAALGKNIDSVTSRIGDLESLSGVLNQRVTVSSAAQTGITRQVAAAAIAAAAQVAQQTGVLPAADSIKDAVAALRADSSDNYSSLLDYQRAAAQANNDLASLGTVADTQLSVAQNTLTLLQGQKDAAQAAYEAEIARLDGVLAYAQQQVDALNGIDTRVLSVQQTLDALRLAIIAAMANPVSGAGATTQAAYNQYLGRSATEAEVAYWQQQATSGRDISSSVAMSDEARIQALYQKYLGRTGEAGGVDWYESALANGATWAQIEKGFESSPEAQARNNPLAAAVDNLTDQMAQMQNSMNRTANATQQFAQQFDSASGGGGALLTEVTNG